MPRSTVQKYVAIPWWLEQCKNINKYKTLNSIPAREISGEKLHRLSLCRVLSSAEGSVVG